MMCYYPITIMTWKIKMLSLIYSNKIAELYFIVTKLTPFPLMLLRNI